LLVKVRVQRAALERVASEKPAGWLQRTLARAIANDGTWVTFKREDLERARRERGLGDWVAVVLEAVGISRFVKRRWPDCGCDRRRRKLNEWWEKLQGCCNPFAARRRATSGDPFQPSV
jgi:hypothetical protein